MGLSATRSLTLTLALMADLDSLLSVLLRWIVSLMRLCFGDGKGGRDCWVNTFWFRRNGGAWFFFSFFFF